MLAPPVHAGGVAAYLPLQLDRGFESDVERVMVLADRPVITRPIAVATVREALPAACAADAPLCARVARRLSRYERGAGITHFSVEAAAAGGAERALPNRHGLPIDSPWQIGAGAYWQINDYVRINLGGVAYRGDVVPVGTMLSVGVPAAQLDIGYRDHWLSPLTDSSMLLGTQAPSMPSVTLSNRTPLTRFGLGYEMFVARMSSSDRIRFGDGFTSGRPRLSGVHLSMAPVDGWSLGVNRLLQFGGGARGGDSVGDILRGFWRPSRFSNTGPDRTRDDTIGNQAASITSRFVFPGSTPFAVYFEYAGEDTSRGRDYLLGNSALSAGIHFPRLGPDLALTWEISEWQNAWYVHSTYLDGLVNDGRVIGHWAGDERLFGDGVGGRSQLLRLGWTPRAGTLFELGYRTVLNRAYSPFDYQRGHEGTLRYSQAWPDTVIGGELIGGRDVFGDSFTRLGVFWHFDGDAGAAGRMPPAARTHGRDPGVEVFVATGINANRVRVDLIDEIPRTSTSLAIAPHVALGVRRAVGERSQIGTRVELDDIDGNLLIGVRALDYRYRFDAPLALGAFIGAARYDLATPAYGIYGGVGAQWTDVVPNWDLGVNLRYAMKVARDNLLPDDPQGERPDSFYDIASATLSISRRF